MVDRRPKPLTLKVQKAAMESNLSMTARHLVHVLCVFANGRTGVGWVGQETIAKAMKCTDRNVRAGMAELSKPDAAPVRLERRPRFRQDGRGRTSDEWRLVLVDASTNRNTMPVSRGDQPEPRSGKSRGLTGRIRPTNRNETTDQPEPRSGDLRSDLRSDQRSSSASTSEAVPFRLSSASKNAPKRKAKKQPAKTHPDPEHGTKHAKVLATYSAEYERARGVKPVIGGREGKAVNALLETLKGDDARACGAIRNAYADPFWRAKATIRTITDDPSKFLGKTAVRVNGHKHDVQGGADDVARLAAKNEELRKLQGRPSLED